MLMQDLLHHWWMGYLKNYCHAQTRPHQASRQVAYLVGPQKRSRELRTPVWGTTAQMWRRVLERELIERRHLEEGVAGQTTT